MPENSEQYNSQEIPKEYQEKEKIASLLREANEGQKIVDLIMESFGKITSIPDVLVLKIEGDNLTLTYIADDGDLGEDIPVNLNQIKRVDLVGDWEPPSTPDSNSPSSTKVSPGGCE